MYFREEQITELENGYLDLSTKYSKLATKYILINFQNTEAQEAWIRGFLRRFKTLFRCIENVYRICPLRLDRKLDSDELSDLDINLQAFIFNIFGCLENLARVLVKEKNIKNGKGEILSDSNIGFPKPPFEDCKDIKYELVLKNFSSEFKDYLNQMSNWFSYLQYFRHSLAHQIPLYVPPYALTKEEDARAQNLESKKWKALENQELEEYNIIDEELKSIGKFFPYMTQKSKSVLFHAQLIADLNTIIEIADNFLQEFDLDKKNS